MTPEERTIVIQALVKFIEDDETLTSFQLANKIFREVIDPVIENERATWLKLLYVDSKNSPH